MHIAYSTQQYIISSHIRAKLPFTRKFLVYILSEGLTSSVGMNWPGRWPSGLAAACRRGIISKLRGMQRAGFSLRRRCRGMCLSTWGRQLTLIIRIKPLSLFLSIFGQCGHIKWLYICEVLIEGGPQQIKVHWKVSMIRKFWWIRFEFYLAS